MNATTFRKGDFYVRAITSRGQVKGYGVYDCIGGMESEHACFMVDEKRNGNMAWKVALYLANKSRDDLNDGIA